LQRSDLDIDLRKVLLESIDETIHVLLGNEPFRILFERLDNDFHLKHEEIPDRVDEFERALTFMFSSAAPVVTRAIAQRLYTKLQISYEKKDCTLKTYLENARRQIERYGADDSRE
jgi:hypothetical protein